jgi:NMD protein affecting ribosome stability and mRNA decay
MEEAYVRLLCPECTKEWESAPTDLPALHRTFHCPNCHASRPTSEFMRTEHDLQTLKSLG